MREISLIHLIDTNDLSDYSILNENGEYLKHFKVEPVSDGFTGNDKYTYCVPDGEVKAITVAGNYYTEKGLRYGLLTEKKTKICPYHLVYPYVFKDSKGKIILMDELLKDKPLVKECDIWSL